MPNETDCLAAKPNAVAGYYLRSRDRAFKTPEDHARNAIGIGVGPRYRNGTKGPDNDPYLRVYVEKKIKPMDKSAAFFIPDKISDVPTDIIETRRFVSFDVAPPGATIGPDYRAPNVDPAIAGTLTAVLNIGNTWYALGANHVMAVNGRVPLGKGILFKPTDKFVNDPGYYVFAHLKAFVRLCPLGTNYVDCALAEVDPGDEAKLKDHYADRIINLDAYTDPIRGNKVQANGAAGLTTGTIEDVHGRVRIDYRFGTFDFDDMVLIKGKDDETPFAQPRDSGSLVVDQASSKPVAIVVGGSQKYTIACRLSRVITDLTNKLQNPDTSKDCPEPAASVYP